MHKKQNLLRSFFFSLPLILLSLSSLQGEALAQKLFDFSFEKSTDHTLQKGDALSINLNHKWLNRPFNEGDSFEIPHAGNENRTYQIVRVSEFLTGITAVFAINPDNPKDQLTFSYDGERLLANINRFDKGLSYQILPLSHHNNKDGLYDHILEYRIPENENILNCGTPSGGNIPAASHDHKSQSHIHSPFDIEAASLEKGVPIDLMVVYTTKAKNWATANRGGIESVMSEMLNLSQQAFDNSRLDIDLRIVQTHHTDYEEVGNNTVEDLRRLTASPDYNPFGSAYDNYMENIHTLRNQSGADLVAMLADVSDVGGVAWQLGSIAGAAAYGFSVNRIQQISNTYTLVHEIGHKMGANHSRNQNDAAANVFGGLFDYSTGWRFTGNSNQSYSTVMTYAEFTSESIPYFSGPENLFDGVPTGSYEGQGAPADNVRSLKYARHIITNYRPTVNHPPLLIADQTPIELEMPPLSTKNIIFTIENEGTSNLYWTADLDYHPQTPPLTKSNDPIFYDPELKAPEKPLLSAGYPLLTRDGDRLIRNQQAPFYSAKSHRTTLAPDIRTSYSLSDLTLQDKTLAEEVPSPVLFETDFETIDEGSYYLLDGWTASPKNVRNLFEISGDNPADGSKHLRLQPVDPQMNPGFLTGVRLPFLGPATAQGYSVSMDINLSRKNSDNQFHIILTDALSNLTTAWVWFDNGNIIIRNRITPEGFDFYNSGGSWQEGSYFNFEIQVDPANDRILYFIDGQAFFNGDLYGGVAPENIFLGHLNHQTGETFDIDNIMVRSLYYEKRPRAGFRKQTGAIASGNSEVIQVQMITDDIPETDYHFGLKILSNDPTQLETLIPVTLTVDKDATSTQYEPVAGHFELYQNYPNPFNPETNIRFQLPVEGHVSLRVYDMLGREAAKLVEENMASGTYTIPFDASSLSSGVYFYQLKSNGKTLTRRMTLLK